jgi:hypothetical protein
LALWLNLHRPWLAFWRQAAYERDVARVVEVPESARAIGA